MFDAYPATDAVVLAQRSSLWDDPRVLASFCGPLGGADEAPRQQQQRHSSPIDGHSHNRSTLHGTRIVEVGSRLMDYQRVRDAKLLAAQQQHQTNDNEYFTGTPKVNPRSAALAQKRNAGLDVQARLCRVSTEPPPAPTPSLTGEQWGTPKINKRSSDMPKRGVEHQLEWHREKLRRHEAKRAAQDADEMDKANGHPKIDEGSRRLAERCSTFKDPMRLVLPVEDRLLRQQEEMHERREALRRELEAEERRATTRVKNSEAAEADAAARLFSDAEERRRQAEERARQEEILGMVGPSGDVLYRPKLSMGSARSPAVAHRKGDLDVFSYLATQPSRYDNSAAEDTEADPHSTGRPHIGAYSVLLANLSRPHNVDTFERLATTPLRSRTSDTQGSTRFKPAVDKKSSQIDRERRGDTVDRVQLLYQRQAGYDAHRRRMQQEKELSDAQEVESLRKLRATKHNTVKVSGDASHAADRAARCVTPDAAYQRMKAWSERNENKLLALRTAAQQEEVASCTFEPSVLRGSTRPVTPTVRKTMVAVRRTPTKA